MKKLFSYFFLVLSLELIFSVNVNAQFNVKANNVILIDTNANQVLYEKNSNQRITAASFTKLMTSVVVFDLIKKDKLNLKDKFIVSKNAWRLSSSGYSAMFVMIGDSVSVENLLRGMIISSGNDACIVLAEGIAGTEKKFVKLMNNKAKKIRLSNTSFSNSTGILTDPNITTVKDIAILSAYLINNYPEYYHYFSEKKFTWNRTGGDPITQGNRNPLLYKNINVDGLKTSYNSSDRYQLASSMKLKNHNNSRIIAVGSGFKNKNDRAKESFKLLTWGKTNYHTFKIVKKEPSQAQKEAKLKTKNIKKNTSSKKSNNSKKLTIPKSQKIKQIDKKVEFTPKQQRLINKFSTYEKKCVPKKKVGLFNKEKNCLKIKDILKLGSFKKPNSYPVKMIGNCKIDNWSCISKKAGQNVYKNFVQRSEKYHARKPGAMIKGMAWYELLYLDNLKKNTKKINRYLTNEPESYFNFKSDVKKINSLIKMNKGRIKMREALGFKIDNSVEEVMKSQWLLASFLNNDEQKVKKVKIHKDIKARKVLLAKYKSAISSYKKKLQENSN